MKHKPVIGANVYLKGSYEGTTSDLEGYFELLINSKGIQELKISSIGFHVFSYSFHSDSIPDELKVHLKEKINELESVVITAGTFEAGDKKQSMVLSAFDVASTASAQGDIYGAFNSVPGTQKVGEEGRLFVRGGESYETKTFMDGLLIANPFYSQLANIPTRGRFSPLLFEGMLFSTGGYSAEYGQALSSIIALKTTGLQLEDKRSLSLMSVGAGFSEVKTWRRSSVSFTGDYINSAFHNKMFGSGLDWQSDPKLINSTLMFRHKVGESGLVKTFASFQLNQMDMRYHNFSEQVEQNLILDDRNVYANTSFTDMLNEKWMFQGGIAYAYNVDRLDLDEMAMRTTNNGQHLKFKATHLGNARFKWKAGVEWYAHHYNQSINLPSEQVILQYGNNQLGTFVEADWQISPKLALRFGGRSEYSSLIGQSQFSPRLSGAFKTGQNSQVSFAYGTFFQNPQEDYLKVNPNLQTERSSHYILNYQYKHENKLFRVEVYNKTYSQLLTFDTPFSMKPEAYHNNGYGSSQGLELFWRDGDTFKNTDYWISYSYNDSKRLYRDYPVETTPAYASAHNLSLVWKRFVPALSSFFCVTYAVASPRPYHDPNLSGYMQSRTNFYHDISLNATYLTHMLNTEAVIHLMVNNVTGRTNIYGYEFSSTQNKNGVYDRKAIVSPIRQQAVLVLMLMF
ncbi:TonB-dependent receptor [Marinilabiliaceae bacterium N1Y90]|nr:TonB-dependent receptor [Marinilabiliaceae bacterium N1Y90]